MHRSLTRSSALVIGVVLLLTFGGSVALAQQAGDDFDTAEPISEGTIEGEIVDGESDFYKIEGNSTDALDVTLTPQNETLEFRIYDSDRQTVVSNGYVSVGSTGQLTVKLPSNGTYYIEVNPDSDQGTSNYTLDVQKVTPDENDQFAPNHDFESAATVPEGVSEATVWGGESDFYKLEATTTDALDVRVTPASGTIEFRIYDENRQEIVSDGYVSEGSTERLTVKLPENGTYYIEVNGDDRQTTTDYTLDVNKVTPTENDQFAPNDGFESAANISEGFSEATIWGGESDFYKLDANTTDVLDIELTPNSDTLEFRIYNENRQEIVSDGYVSEGSTGRLTVKLPANGTYYIEVNGENRQTTTDYTLNLNKVTPDENDEFAPNDGFESAANISEGFSEATIWGGESDFYKIEANTTDALDIQLTPNSDTLEFRIYDENRQEIVSDGYVSADSTGQLTVKLPETGTYYIEVNGENQQTTTDYTLNLNKVTPAENDEFAPNDNFTSAALVDEEFQNGKIWGGESDFFVLELDRNESLAVRMTPESSTLEFRVYGPTREEIASDSYVNSGSTGTLEITADQSGRYYIEVNGESRQTTAAYELQSNKTTSELGLPIVIGDSPPTDPDGDGKYEDINGNGGLDIGDVQALFANQNSAAVQANVEAFDFNDNGGLDIGDVQALFNEL